MHGAGDQEDDAQRENRSQWQRHELEAATTRGFPFMGRKLGKPAALKRRARKSEKVTPKPFTNQHPDLTALDKQEETARKP